MRAIVQRVAWAKVSVEGTLVGQCRSGLLVLVGAHREDSEANAVRLADRLVKLRIFNDPDGKMNLAIGDGQGILVVSNFTVYGETAKNRRPSFTDSAPYEAGKDLVDRLVSELRRLGIPVETGEFGADMQVELLNDGPVTVIVDA
ncbi:MAG: D-tyrosyl-tRNA(Tyr) deacylase [Fimbriimonadaceae bacterium]|nr:D-tyrosyl-tRNA(Tyr) deacylase [Fimbriimonadaceae bacterium]